MKKSKIIAMLAVLMVAFGGLLTHIPANSAIFDGGGGGGASPPGSSGTAGQYTLKWVYVSEIDHFFSPNKRYGTDSPGAAGSAQGVYPEYEQGPRGLTAVKKAVREASPNGKECLASGTKAIFMLETTPRYNNTWASHMRSGGRANWRQQPSNNTWESLYRLYVNNGGNDASIKDQLSKKKGPISPNLNVICVTPDKDPNPKRWVEVPNYKKETETKSTTCAASANVTVKRQLSERVGGKLVDPIGKDNLHNQPMSSKETEFYKRAQILQKNKDASPEELVKSLQNACKETDLTNTDVELTQKNKEGLAEGGVLNVQLSSTNMTFTSSKSKETFVSCKAFEEEEVKKGQWVRTGKSKDCSKNHPKEKNVTPTVNKLSYQTTPKDNGFWQIVSVHCNKAEFDKLVQASGAKVIEATENPNGTISALAYSKHYDKTPQYFDFGDKSNPNADLAKSGHLGFYDKECGYRCVPANANSPVDNIRDQAPAVNGTKGDPANVNKSGYGAVNGENNTNNLEFFRDNERKNIKVDVWYPANVDGVSYNPKDPIQNKSTTVVKWAEGTPSTGANNGGEFKMFGKSGSNWEAMFIGNAKTPATQTNAFGITAKMDASKTPHAHTLRGIVNEFEVQSNWASDSDKPHKFNFKWEFAPVVKTIVPNKGMGFDKDGKAVYGTQSTANANVEGKCYAQFGTDNYSPALDTVGKFQQHTGTGTTNNLDADLIQPNDNSELTVRFVRSTSE